jgi:chromosome segregation and condensation protein ScpB
LALELLRNSFIAPKKRRKQPERRLHYVQTPTFTQTFKVDSG